MAFSVEEAGETHRTRRLVVRNVLFLVGAQLLGMPLSLVVNAVMASHLGPQEFGVLYVAGTLTTFGFLTVEWGQAGTLPALVAKDRARAGHYLGSALVWRLSAAPVAYGVLTLICLLLKYDAKTQLALGLLVLMSTIDKVAAAFQDVDRGFERADMVAYRTMGAQLGAALLVVPTLLLGGRLREVLLAQSLCGAIMLVLVVRAVKPKVGALSYSLDTVKKLLADGYGFLLVGLAMLLQPNIDAAFLSKLAPGDPVGWYAAARRLVGVLIFPVGAITTALYPTLCRLHAEDPDSFRRTTSSALRLVTVLAVPVTVACALYPDVAIRIFGRVSFGPAADDLRLLSLFILLVYFTMTLGIAILASGRQRTWALTMVLCVAVSSVVDPLLVPWFQARRGNGGLGVCVASVGSELVMLLGGLWLAPRGLFDRKLRRELLLALLAGGVMVGTARLLSGITPFVAGPAALLAYTGCLFLTGGIDKEQIQTFRSLLRRKVQDRSVS